MGDLQVRQEGLEQALAQEKKHFLPFDGVRFWVEIGSVTVEFMLNGHVVADQTLPAAPGAVLSWGGLDGKLPLNVAVG
jgi:hypothetical protein